MVVKINSSGVIEWENTIGGTGEDQLHSIEQTADGGYFLGGFSNSYLSGDKTEDNIANSTDWWVIKLNSTGGIVWQNTIFGDYADYLYSAHQTSDGGYILGGYSSSGIAYDKTEVAYGDDYWIMKLNSTGGTFSQLTKLSRGICKEKKIGFRLPIHHLPKFSKIKNCLVYKKNPASLLRSAELWCIR